MAKIQALISNATQYESPVLNIAGEQVAENLADALGTTDFTFRVSSSRNLKSDKKVTFVYKFPNGKSSTITAAPALSRRFREGEVTLAQILSCPVWEREASTGETFYQIELPEFTQEQLEKMGGGEELETITANDAVVVDMDMLAV